ncbi:hypothetical protein A3195_16910 [Candidatus Thiodiazotropha endoloripes]|uniref:SMEK domain-containing protein n=1 Tax=Candidatus Thiodiazotropha endoloripes TaxID=1818881 RepID=UPI00083CC40E|nr:SMEK domain-containing protein [Candidatus Thiodiazotropha endoloripes]ODB85279.1 hypothetical protein A3195_16910 [Candidatus Thiodiazotropha endoloripes]
MKHQNLLNELRDALGQFAHQIEAAGAMQLYDINKISEDLICGLMRELFDLPNLKNLNAEKKKNYPGIDLADDTARVAIQVTATSGIDKIKGTLETFISHDLHNEYDRLIVYILGRKQASYSQGAIDKICDSKFSFLADRDVMDHRDLAEQSVKVTPKQLVSAVDIMHAYLRGIDGGLAEEDFDPSEDPMENVHLNLLELFFPPTLYIAQLNSDFIPSRKGRSQRNYRKHVQGKCREMEIRIPSGFEASAGNIITFYDLEDDNNPYSALIEKGTVEPIGSSEFCEIDEDHERIFKSLLRFTLQHRLYKEDVVWKHKDRLFVFLPRSEGDDVREESWRDKRQSTRKVFERKYNKNDPSKAFSQKHLAFSVEFLRTEDSWYVAITPDWFFSYGDNFHRSGYAQDNIKWLKRQEINLAVSNHFRFLSVWLKSIDEEDLFTPGEVSEKSLSFGGIATLGGHPSLDDSKWLPRHDRSEEEDMPQTGRLFG